MYKNYRLILAQNTGSLWTPLSDNEVSKIDGTAVRRHVWSGRLNWTALFSIQCKHTQHFRWQIYIIHLVNESKFSYSIMVNLTSKIKPKSILQQKVLLWSFIIQNVSYFAKRKVFVVKKAYFIGLLVLVSMFALHVAICDKLKAKK